MDKAVTRFLQHHKISFQSKIIVAFSGGSDSVCLADLLFQLGYRNLVLAYFHHHTRTDPEHAEDILVLKQASVRYSAVYEIGHLTQVSRQDLSGGREAVLRQARYDFLYQILDKYNADYLALAHHADDNAETLLMRLFQGQAYTAIPSKRDSVIRPLLAVRKKDILEYLQQKSLGYSDDRTNSESEYARNFLRNNIIPLLEHRYPSLKGNLEKHAGEMAALTDYLDTNSRIQYTQEKSCIIVNQSSFEQAAEIERSYFLKKIIPQLQLKNKRINLRRFSFLIDRPVLQNGLKYRNSELTVHVNKGSIFLKKVAQSGKKEYLMVVRSGMAWDWGSFSMEVSSANELSFDGICLSKQVLVEPCLIRSPRHGDTIIDHQGKKTIKALLNSWGLGSVDKENCLLLQDRLGVCAVFGSQFGQKNRISSRFFECDQKQRNYLKIKLYGEINAYAG